MEKKRALLVSLRSEKSLTQKDVVNLLRKQYGVDITESYYGMIEQGVRTPKLNTALAISKLFNVSPEDIFFEHKHNKNLGSSNTKPA